MLPSTDPRHPLSRTPRFHRPLTYTLFLAYSNLLLVMSAAALDAFYRGREEPLPHINHVPYHLERFVDAVEGMVRDEQARAASMPALHQQRAVADTTRVHEIRAAVAYADRMARDVQITPPKMHERIQHICSAADSLTRIAKKPLHASPGDEYWNDYLYEGLDLLSPTGVDAATTYDATDDQPPLEPDQDSEEMTSVRPSQSPSEVSVAGTANQAHQQSSTALPSKPELRQRHKSANEGAPSSTLSYSSAGDRPSYESVRPNGNKESRAPMLQSDRSLQDALSSELLRMAGVLKANTVAFSESLERDRMLVESATGRLDQNLSLMTRTRGQLGVFTKKARSMGWFTLGSIASVIVCWVLMFIVIRVT